eukprot:783625-Prymnesium_polylepis.1
MHTQPTTASLLDAEAKAAWAAGRVAGRARALERALEHERVISRCRSVLPRRRWRSALRHTLRRLPRRRWRRAALMVRARSVLDHDHLQARVQIARREWCSHPPSGV